MPRLPRTITPENAESVRAGARKVYNKVKGVGKAVGQSYLKAFKRRDVGKAAEIELFKQNSGYSGRFKR